LGQSVDCQTGIDTSSTAANHAIHTRPSRHPKGWRLFLRRVAAVALDTVYKRAEKNFEVTPSFAAMARIQRVV
jgi:hypothetical protein